MQWEAPSKPLAVDDPLFLPEREVHAEIDINWILDQEIPKGGYVRIQAESRSPTWSILRALQKINKAKSLEGKAIMSAPPFFQSAGRGDLKFWGERLDKSRIRTTEGLSTCMEPHRGWTIASSSWNFLRKRWLDRELELITVIQEETKRTEEKKKLGIDHQRGQYYEHFKRSTKPRDLKARR